SKLYDNKNPVLILDEPTTVLSEDERQTLFSILRDITNQASTVLISHRLQEIIDNSDRIVILKDGKNAGEFGSERPSIRKIEMMMVGRTLETDRFRESEQLEPKEEVVLTVENLSKQGAFEPIDFLVRRGEIVSLVGLVGSGKEQLCRCIAGLEKQDSGSVLLGSRRLVAGLPRDAVNSGVGFVPIDRRNEGLALGMTVSENVNLLVLNQLKVAGLLSPRREKENAERWIKGCQVKAPSYSTRCANLSGGNQQKVVMAKWLTSEIQFLIIDHPTRGVDVGAKEEIYRLIRKLANDGMGMIIMCDTLEEDIGLCSRMFIMKDGRLITDLACPAYRKPNPSDIITLIV
ncbi:MAG: sugar ABC transporter ATP-binding protein, partial [Verrucomicrobia bacterium]|nr:sugar ABC transporter ATP-binding protein [Verrucomicrobiota bacterium]